MIARWPGTLPDGQVLDGVATVMDLFPTFVELAGGELPADRKIDGKNIFRFLQGKESSPHFVLYCYQRRTLFAVRHGDWKLHLYKRETSKVGGLGKQSPVTPLSSTTWPRTSAKERIVPGSVRISWPE